eukprot:CAMPEP_0172087602 /NCGR_PEP_ID=MMETSP1043-20130122/22773_1 /TAXON_ID=464988 /ORGANISM="Hemiselmis andersenii, Strain CCMP441" /LENGTH=111 /DNA_ID=CAMNT_0012749821 /DNA_START=117 /DNA_END=448 /DNA_ORIENTATION=+
MAASSVRTPFGWSQTAPAVLNFAKLGPETRNDAVLNVMDPVKPVSTTCVPLGTSTLGDRVMLIKLSALTTTLLAPICALCQPAAATGSRPPNTHPASTKGKMEANPLLPRR